MRAEIWPNFFIVGAAKAGTTSLYQYLQQHPQIYMSPVKEPHYFSQVDKLSGRHNLFKVVTDRDAYLNLFKNAAKFTAVGEASTSYLGFEETADLIYQQLPEARIVILLRDPIERSFSHYLMDVRDGIQELSFYDSILKEIEDPEFGWPPAWHRYIMFYYPGVKRYLDVFGANRVLILFTEDLQRDPHRILRKVARFLGLDTAPVDFLDFSMDRNPYRVPRSKLTRLVARNSAIRSFGEHLFPKPVLQFVRDKILFERSQKPALDEQTREMLREIYKDDIAKLETLLGFHLPELRRSWEPEDNRGKQKDGFKY